MIYLPVPLPCSLEKFQKTESLCQGENAAFLWKALNGFPMKTQEAPYLPIRWVFLSTWASASISTPSLGNPGQGWQASRRLRRKSSSRRASGTNVCVLQKRCVRVAFSFCCVHTRAPPDFGSKNLLLALLEAVTSCTTRYRAFYV